MVRQRCRAHVHFIRAPYLPVKLSAKGGKHTSSSKSRVLVDLGRVVVAMTCPYGLGLDIITLFRR